MDPFKVRVTGTITFKGIDASDARIEADRAIEDLLGSLSLDDARVESANIDVEAEVYEDDVEVQVVDIEDFDAESYIDNAVNHWDVRVGETEFEVTDSPPGFEVIEEQFDRDTAVGVYVALANAGFDVS